MITELIISILKNWTLVLTVLIVLLILSSFKLLQYNNMINKIPGPKYNRIFGSRLKGKREDLFINLNALLKPYAGFPVIKVWFWWTPRVFIMKAAAAEIVLNAPALSTKSRTYKNLQPWLGLGLLTSGGEKWQLRRKLITPTFHFRILEDFFETMKDQSDILVSILKQNHSRIIDIYPYIARCALDIICQTAMGKCKNVQMKENSEYLQALHDETEVISCRGIRNPLLSNDWLFNLTHYKTRQDKALKILHGFTNKIIKERKETLENKGSEDCDSEKKNGHQHYPTRKKAFLDLLLDLNVNKNTLSDEDIREEVDTFMLEGHDTTASGMGWVMYNIGRFPEVQAKVHQELDAIFGSSERAITFQDVTELKYLERVIKESARLFPPVPIYSRNTSEDISICGYTIPADTRVIINAYMLHRDPDVFPDPETFDPDRFLSENCVQRHPYGYLPFSAGPRNCIGQKFAMIEEKVLISQILRWFTVKSLDDNVKPNAELVLRAPNGIRVILEPRHWSCCN